MSKLLEYFTNNKENAYKVVIVLATDLFPIFLKVMVQPGFSL